MIEGESEFRVKSESKGELRVRVRLTAKFKERVWARVSYYSKRVEVRVQK
jgi:hypothetical protein